MIDALLITPPFTQLNTPYPATAYLKGFLNTKGISSFQVDLGLDVVLKLFTKETLKSLFLACEPKMSLASENAQRIFAQQKEYLHLMEDLIAFLQGKNPTLSYRFASLTTLPKASRFEQLADDDFSFGTMGIHDKAKYYGTLLLEDLADFIQEVCDPHFGFSRYAEKLSRSAYTFDALYDALQQPLSFIEQLMLEELDILCKTHQPQVIAFSVPFPGNVFAALRCAQYVKQMYPQTPIALGGGFANTELRSLKEKRLFEFVDAVMLDDGEAPFEVYLNYLKKHIPSSLLKRTFILEDAEVVYQNGSLMRDYKQHETGTPDYSDLQVNQYISVLEVANPMNRLWSDGRWNKLTMAHGCYWGKCTFCDIHLPYIRDYEPIQAAMLVDRMITLIQQTGCNGFHFVDEAAPPALMKELALEILKRNVVVTWWTNIRFEKSFTPDVCYLLKASGCIGVSGGLEVASDRLLQLIDKGITIEQVSKVLKHFKLAGIMVHAYLMYGYPTQTEQETLDSLEVVRQLFQTGILQSAFWHQFALTVHSPIARNPETYQITIDETAQGPFANNDLRYTESKKIDHGRFSFGLKKSLFNYMHGVGLEQPLSSWFDFKTPSTSVANQLIEAYLNEQRLPSFSDNARVICLASKVQSSSYIKSKKGKQWPMMDLQFYAMTGDAKLTLGQEQATWFLSCLNFMYLHSDEMIRFKTLRESFEQQLPLDDFDLLWYNKIYPVLKHGILLLV